MSRWAVSVTLIELPPICSGVHYFDRHTAGAAAALHCDSVSNFVPLFWSHGTWDYTPAALTHCCSAVSDSKSPHRTAWRQERPRDFLYRCPLRKPSDSFYRGDNAVTALPRELGSSRKTWTSCRLAVSSASRQSASKIVQYCAPTKHLLSWCRKIITVIMIIIITSIFIPPVKSFNED